jgi:antitoxin (DNA-binding transcriptional repressor) of toxin-antitoxin stability system
MEHRISSTDLVRRLGDVLSRVRYLGDTFTIERSGDPIARLVPLPGASPTTLREAFAAWSEAGEPEAGFADALELVSAADQPPDDAWAS